MTAGKWQATIVRPGEGETVHVSGDDYRFLATGPETDRNYMILEADVPPGGGPPLHQHAREEEGFYILAGQIDFVVDGADVRAGAGTFLNLPKGCQHRFRNTTDQPARLLILCAPAGIEGYFREADGQQPPALTAIAERYGITIIPPS